MYSFDAGIVVILTDASSASVEKDLGQLRANEAGTGFEIAQRSLLIEKHYLRWRLHRTSANGSAEFCDWSSTLTLLPSGRRESAALPAPGTPLTAPHCLGSVSGELPH